MDRRIYTAPQNVVAAMYTSMVYVLLCMRRLWGLNLFIPCINWYITCSAYKLECASVLVYLILINNLSNPGRAGTCVCISLNRLRGAYFRTINQGDWWEHTLLVQTVHYWARRDECRQTLKLAFSYNTSHMWNFGRSTNTFILCRIYINLKVHRTSLVGKFPHCEENGRVFRFQLLLPKLCYTECVVISYCV